MSKDHTGFPGGMLDLESLRPRDGAATASPDARIEELRKGLFEARDAMRVMSNWVKQSDPAGHSWGVRMVDRANAVLYGASAATVAEPSGGTPDTYPARLLHESDASLAERVDSWHKRHPQAAQPQAEPGADERAAFEAWLAAHPYPITWHERGAFFAGYRAAQSGQRAGVEEGWQLVPKEPTFEMLEAGDCAWDSASSARERYVYKAMLAAAPEAK